jgi:hypothetical protein
MTPKNPCARCGAYAVGLSSLCHRCYVALRGRQCEACGGPKIGTYGRYCGACYQRQYRQLRGA